MKNLKLLGMVLMTMIMCFSISACTNDDEDETIPSKFDLLGTTWRGTSNSWNEHYILFRFENYLTGVYYDYIKKEDVSGSFFGCSIKVYDGNGDLTDTDGCSVVYDDQSGDVQVNFATYIEQNGEYVVTHSEGYTGNIRGGKIQLSSSTLGSLVLTKQ